jgi:hypothetical protein
LSGSKKLTIAACTWQTAASAADHKYFTRHSATIEMKQNRIILTTGRQWKANSKECAAGNQDKR